MKRPAPALPDIGMTDIERQFMQSSTDQKATASSAAQIVRLRPSRGLSLAGGVNLITVIMGSQNLQGISDKNC